MKKNEEKINIDYKQSMDSNFNFQIQNLEFEIIIEDLKNQNKNLLMKLEDLDKNKPKDYIKIFESSLEGFVYCKMIFENGKPTDFLFLDANTTFKNIISAPELIGLKASDLFSVMADESDVLLSILGSVSSTRVPQKTELYFKPLGIWLSISVSSPEIGYFIAIVNDITQRILADEELKISQLKYSELANSITDVFFGLNNELEITYWNNSSEKILNITTKSIIGKKFKDVSQMNPYIDDDIKIFKKVISTNRTFNYQRQFELEDRQLTLEFTVYPTYNGLIIFGKDVTQRIETEQALKKSEAKYRVLFESIPTGVTVLDEKGNFIESNVAANRILDLSSVENINQHFKDLSNKTVELNNTNISSVTYSYLGSLNDKKSMFQFEMNIVKENKELSWISVNASPVPGYGVVILFDDITERKLSEQALQRSEQRYRRLHESLIDGFAQVNMQGQIIDYNDSYLNMLGYSSEEVTKLTYQDITPVKWKEIESKIVEEQILPLGYSEVYEKEYIRKDGSIIPVELRTFLLKNDDGENTGMWAIVRDITERKRVEKLLEESKNQLKELNSTKDKFFSIIAHDLRSPLGSFRKATQFIYEFHNDLSNEERLDFLNLIRESAHNIYSLLENLLEWSLSQQGLTDFNPISIDLSGIIIDSIELLRLSAKTKNISIKNNVTASTIIVADPNLITTIIRNLLSNALRFTSENGIISIEFTRNPDSVEFSVADSGVGMSKDVLNKIFRIDTKISTKDTNQGTGTGLGLILCKEFVERHKGKLFVESEIGKGSKFTVQLPQ